MSSKRGSLTIAGAGVASIGQLTLETVAAIEHADIVCYLLGDPATEAFVLKKNPNAYDLYQLYDDGKPRMETHVQISEVLLSKVREGQNVLGLFYGHPFGNFAILTQRSLGIARREGYRVKMLPGVSVEEAVLACTDIDPYMAGAATYNATELVQNKRLLSEATRGILIIAGAGIVGNPGFNFSSSSIENTDYDKLVDIIEENYSPDRNVLHLIPTQLPIVDLVPEKLKISDLRKPEFKKKLCPSSVLSITPDPTLTFSPFQTAEGKKLERKAMSDLANHQPGKNYPRLKENLALSEALERLALDPLSLEAYKLDRHAWVNENGRALSDEERNALITGRGIMALMSEGPAGETRVIPC